MKKCFFISLLFLTLGSLPLSTHAQIATDTAKVATKKIVIIEKNDGTQFIGVLISQDMREVIIETENMGQIAIPKHEIKSMEEAKQDEVSANGEYIPNEVFSTRYFLTTNGLPIERGESYVQWNLFGPDFQFGVGKNFGMGIMTSWIGMPIIGTAKYSVKLGKKANLGIGTLLGTGSWIKPDFYIALPFAALTFGDRKMNLNFAAGYGAVGNNGNSNGRFIISIGAMAKVDKKVSLVFDSFIMPGMGYHTETYYTQTYDGNGNYSYGTTTREVKNPGWALLVPGVRFQLDSKKAFQFGFGGLVYDSEIMPVPIPFVQWFRKF